MKKNIRKARPTCMKKKKSKLSIDVIDLTENDDLQIIYVHHPCGTLPKTQLHEVSVIHTIKILNALLLRYSAFR